MPPNDSFTRRIFSATVSGSPTSSAPVGPSCASKCARVIGGHPRSLDRKSTRLNSSHSQISYAVFCLKKKIHRHGKRLPVGPQVGEEILQVGGRRHGERQPVRVRSDRCPPHWRPEAPREHPAPLALYS